MTDSTPAPGGDLGTPALGKLLKTVAITLGAAAVVFVVVILPAEYGIDPTRIGGHGYAANAVLMTVGFLLVAYQLTGYFTS